MNSKWPRCIKYNLVVREKPGKEMSLLSFIVAELISLKIITRVPNDEHKINAEKIQPGLCFDIKYYTLVLIGIIL